RFLFAQQADRVGGGGGAGDGEGVGGGPEGGGEGDLVARGHGEQFGGGTEQSGEPVLRREQRAGAVLAAQAEGEGLVAGPGRGALAFDGGDRLAGRGE